MPLDAPVSRTRAPSRLCLECLTRHGLSVSCAIVKSVPRNRIDVARDAKLEPILDRAETTLRASGFDGLSIARMARELGVAQNTIYWYFGDKDGVLVGVLERASKRALSQLSRFVGRGPIELILAAVDRLADLGPLDAAMRQRAPHAESVRVFEAAFDSSLNALLRDALRDHVHPEELDDVADAFHLAASGALAQHHPRARRRRLLRRVLEALVSQASSSG
jgi:AcrR family transcriptional regulator